MEDATEKVLYPPGNPAAISLKRTFEKNSLLLNLDLKFFKGLKDRDLGQWLCVPPFQVVCLLRVVSLQEKLTND